MPQNLDPKIVLIYRPHPVYKMNIQDHKMYPKLRDFKETAQQDEDRIRTAMLDVRKSAFTYSLEAILPINFYGNTFLVVSPNKFSGDICTEM
jgi:hypothetical protein